MKLSDFLWIGGMLFMFIYGAVFIEDGKVDSTDEKVMIGVVVVMLFVIAVSFINSASDSGKNITVKSVIGAILLLILFVSYLTVPILLEFNLLFSKINYHFSY
ncbi:hypothetical protein [Pseudalkalibacillus hwajinpoensis]|uniref:Uncharacterized protein n=1 Tax=Guptibacillus hwajinpoensis TaxID=208199 RepID=A0A4V6WRV9_9BACL|nr:hypothetical protein [Pseudalkalibacillus hwajinpoensis]TKD66328.1 hypothetical protein FBF83_20320 [Pseudalkalibacillus hwajinpoensis]